MGKHRKRKAKSQLQNPRNKPDISQTSDESLSASSPEASTNQNTDQEEKIKKLSDIISEALETVHGSLSQSDNQEATLPSPTSPDPSWIQQTPMYSHAQPLAGSSNSGVGLKGHGQYDGHIMQMASNIDCILKKMGEVDEKVTGIDNKMSRLEQKIMNIDTKVSQLDEIVHTLQQKCKDLEKATQFMSDHVDRVDGIEGLVSTLSSEMETAMKGIVHENIQLKEQVLDLQTRSMRDNLIIFELEEHDKEDTEKKVLQFFEDMLHIEHASNNIKIERAHRLGPRSQKKKRPVVVKFSSFKDRECIRKHSNQLRGTKYSIAEQFPREILDRRKALLPHLKNAKAKGHRVSMVVDKLFIDGKLFSLPDDKK